MRLSGGCLAHLQGRRKEGYPKKIQTFRTSDMLFSHAMFVTHCRQKKHLFAKKYKRINCHANKVLISYICCVYFVSKEWKESCYNPRKKTILCESQRISPVSSLSEFTFLWELCSSIISFTTLAYKFYPFELDCYSYTLSVFQKERNSLSYSTNNSQLMHSLP